MSIEPKTITNIQRKNIHEALAQEIHKAQPNIAITPSE